MVARIYDRPDLDQDVYQPALYVNGRFARAKPSLAYEGRLQIRNSIGGCSVLQIGGDKLPEGSQLRVDQLTKEVVVAWPAYQTAQAPIANPGFEDGPTGWVTGPGWVIATENPPTGQWAAGYNNNPGQSRISSASRYSVQVGQVTSAKCDVRQGASSEGNAGASVMLEYRNAAGEVIHTVEGNQVLSASKNRVYPSSVFGAAPPGAATINVAGNGIRYRENKILFVDNFEWDHTVPSAGINFETVLNVVLRVNDSIGRSFVWSGQIMVAARPVAYRVFASSISNVLNSLSYRHAANALDRLGYPENATTSNQRLIGVADDGSIAATTYATTPQLAVYPVSQDGIFGAPFAAPVPPLTEQCECVAFSRSGAAMVVGHGNAPYLRAHAVSPAGIGAAYPAPATALTSRVMFAQFNPAGDVLYLVQQSPPYLVAYRWDDVNGLGARLNSPALTTPSAVQAISINESGTHLAAICGASPSCHIYKIGPDGFEDRIAAFGQNAQGMVALSDAARAVVFGSSFMQQMHLYLWDPANGVGAAYPVPPAIGAGTLARGVSFSRDGLVLYVGVTSTLGVLTYEWTPGVGTTRGPVQWGTTSSQQTIPID
ncbi:TPA: hypothetical protein R4K21_003022 [Stenotrophomonas maltophilia]|nr:hypothetical protein [Stenotrophomonas maltophilia]